MNFKFFTLISLVILILGCKKEEKNEDSCNSLVGANTIIHNGGIREFMLYIPTSYHPDSTYSLMLNFHGYGGKANEHMANTNMNQIAEQEDFIVAYPQGLCLDGSSHWNAALNSSGNKSNVDDLDFVTTLINHLSQNYNIDNERVYACGYSNGGFFSYALACYLSDKIAAIGSVSGTMLSTSTNCNPTHPTPIIDLHGTSDFVVPYTGGEGYIPKLSVLDYWTTFNGNNKSPIINAYNSSGLVIEHYTFENNINNISIEHYKINGGEHIWFTNDFQGKSTSKVIWDFVSKYDINGIRE